MGVDPGLLASLLGARGVEAGDLARTARRLEALLAEARQYDDLFPETDPPTETDHSPMEKVDPAPVAEALERIKARNDELNAFVTVLIDHPPAMAPAGPLHGLPVAVKDIYHVRGARTTAGSRILANYVSDVDAAIVRQLRAAGAIIIGKTATHEFAYGCTTDSPFQGPTRNPVDPSRTPGGSSGGSAAAVAAGMVPVAMGTDTGGSVRVPAACCGVVGFKPSYGRLSMLGIISLSPSLDHAGPIARSVADVARVHAALTGEEKAACPQRPKVGVPVNWLTTPIDADVRGAFERSLSTANPVEVELPPLELFHFASRVITLAEAGAYHARFLDRLGEYGPDVRARVELGQFVLARDYLLAQRLRTELTRRMQAALAGVDALATPTMPLTAPRIGERHLADAMLRFTIPFNVTGQPAISLPCGRAPNGLPIGLQLIAVTDAQLLGLAQTFEGAMYRLEHCGEA